MTRLLLQDPGLPVANPTKAYWQVPPNTDLLNIQSDVLPAKRDVVIIGSGVTALSVSWWLLKENKDISISVLEAREICSGATGRNGGRINTPAVQDFAKYRRLYDDKTAVDIVNFELAHFQAIQVLVEELGPEAREESEIREVEAIACAFTLGRVSELETDLRDFEAFFPHLRGRWRMADSLEVTKHFGVTNAKGALIGTAGALWPYRLFTRAFSHLLSKHQPRYALEANTAVLEVKREAGGGYPYRVVTARGVIHAKHVIHCTEGHAAHLLPRFRGILVPRKGQMTVQSPGSGFPQRSSRSWNFYVNNMDYATQNPTTGDLFVGGGDVLGLGPALGTASDAEQAIGALSHLGGVLPAVFGLEHWGTEVPGQPRVKAAWTGILCNSLDHVPLVGRVTPRDAEKSCGWEEPDEWLSAGYGGYGMVNAFLCGKAVAHMIQGKDVSTWLPQSYVVTQKRLANLQARLKRVARSEREHIRAML